jgi:hypothetical protein
MIVGSGQFKYRANAEWAKLPDGWSFNEVGGVGVDSKRNVYVFNRGEHPMIAFDRQGNFLRSWSEGQYPRLHGYSPDGAARIGVQVGHPNLVARDMGGTSFDVSLIATGGPALSAEKDIAYGVPLDFIP